MTTPRRQQISLSETPFYHCVSRCVRRAFLCGKDRYSGRNFEHRRAWIEERLLSLQSVFCIDVCAYAVMSNHYHVVLHVDAEKANSLTAKQVADRWMGLFKGSLLMQRFQRGEQLDQSEFNAVNLVIEQWRKRLADVSWYMRCCNEWLAREANKEDECTGRFWEGRFKSQALLDDKALLACMAYVDLNPLRAKMVKLPEDSNYTSIKMRISRAKESVKNTRNPDNIQQQAVNLFPFAGYPRKNQPRGLSFRLRDYLELVDWTGRQIRNGKRGTLHEDTPGILVRLDIEPMKFLTAATQFESRFKSLAGGVSALRQKAKNFGLCRLSSLGAF
ncbi:transposase [uncultured Pseudoteredinibacter sp.]|uniref:transposase n=1 Tax=uncultured Pseudoteredinibacter sp. TaxID=1641701 RepID=UPI00261B2BC1|nr:transposase [uncultured Pseudoteredinibacter sp.]